MKRKARTGRMRFRAMGVAAVLAMVVAPMFGSGAQASSWKVPAFGELDCNGQSPIQHALKGSMLCTDLRGFAGVSNRNTWGGRFYDNGKYIGHDEPDMTFYSTAKGSGNNVTWSETLGRDPVAIPTATNPGHDVADWFELSPAPWFSMAVCDPNSYPQTFCKPDSDVNAPACPNLTNCPKTPYPGGGSAFLELQFYPPGNPPWVDSSSCDNSHWCAALTIDSLECTQGYGACNSSCEEPVNFAFIQTNGVPVGPPSPQQADIQSSVPNAQTLLMNPGDKVTTHIFDAPVPGEKGQRALEAVVDDLTTKQSGFMQASAANGFQNTSIVNCSGTPFNFEPEYSTASKSNIISWAALQTNISTEFETGHWEPCASVSEPLGSNPFDSNDTGGAYNSCVGPYETAGGDEGAEAGDAMCYVAGDVHTGYAGPGTSTPPDRMTGCQDNLYQNGDLDFDGTPYWPEWPTSSSVTPSLPASFVESPPRTKGHRYPQFRFQTDVALSESTCKQATPKSAWTGCSVPPATAPGHFYPYWSEVVSRSGACSILFGNVSAGKRLNDFHKDAEFGKNKAASLGYPEFEGAVHDNVCKK
jgi:hypothetical protein